MSDVIGAIGVFAYLVVGLIVAGFFPPRARALAFLFWPAMVAGLLAIRGAIALTQSDHPEW